MLLNPALSFTADSTGLLLVHLIASDPSGIKSVDFFLLPGTSAFNTITPLDTAVDAYFSIPLGIHKHTVFQYYARSRDILDHETVTDTVTVTVR